MIYLLLAVAALAAGPLALGWLRRREGLASSLDGFVVVAIPGLVFFQFVPDAIEHREYAVLVALAPIAVLVSCLWISFLALSNTRSRQAEVTSSAILIPPERVPDPSHEAQTGSDEPAYAFPC